MWISFSNASNHPCMLELKDNKKTLKGYLKETNPLEMFDKIL